MAAKKLRPPDQSNDRYCDLCGRRMPEKHAVWCRVCISRHTIGTPCRNCDGRLHIPPGISVLVEDGKL